MLQVRSSTDRAHVAGRESVQFEGDLAEGEAVFEVTLAGATLEGQASSYSLDNIKFYW